MPAFILRHIGTNKLAGFYAADNETQLFYLIDQETSPGDYEYAIISEGYGIEFRRGHRTVDSTIGDDNIQEALAGASRVYLTAELLSALTGDEELVWHRFFEDLR